MNSCSIKAFVSISIIAIIISGCHATPSKAKSENSLSSWNAITTCTHNKSKCDIYAVSNRNKKIHIVTYIDEPKYITLHKNNLIEIGLACGLDCSAISFFKPPNNVGGPFPFIAVNYENEIGLIADVNPIETRTIFGSERPLSKLYLDIDSANPQASGKLLDVVVQENGFLIKYRSISGEVKSVLMPYSENN